MPKEIRTCMRQHSVYEDNADGGLQPLLPWTWIGAVPLDVFAADRSQRKGLLLSGQDIDSLLTCNHVPLYAKKAIRHSQQTDENWFSFVDGTRKSAVEATLT